MNSENDKPESSAEMQDQSLRRGKRPRFIKNGGIVPKNLLYRFHLMIFPDRKQGRENGMSRTARLRQRMRKNLICSGNRNPQVMIVKLCRGDRIKGRISGRK